MRKGRRIYPFLLLLAFALLLFFGNRFATFYTDWLWYRNLGQEVVFTRIYGTRILLFFVFGATTFLLAYLNIWLTERISPPGVVETENQMTIIPAGNAQPLGRTMQALTSFRTTLDMLLLVGALIFGIGTGVTAQAQWDAFLRFQAPVAFGVPDPVFGKDISFYVFTLPFVRYVQTWLLTILLIIGGGTALVYMYQQGINSASGRTVVQPHVRAHLSAIAALALLVRAWGYSLDRFDLLFSDGRFPGAGYTDLHARMPIFFVLLIVTLLAAAAVAMNIWRRSVALPVITLSLWVLFFLAGMVVPYLLQRLRVLPNEASRENPYIPRAIKATREAYDLNSIRVENLDPNTILSRKDLATYPATLQNLSIWDFEPLMEITQQRQSLRQFYRFLQMDDDRYFLKDGIRQTQVAVREIAPDQLDTRALTWQNLFLRYTHGYGAVAAASGEVAAGGGPNYLLKNVPPVASDPEIELKQPRIYFGLSLAYDFYSAVNTRLPEFDYPTDTRTDESLSQPYEGKGGIALTPFNRFAFALRFTTWSLILSQDITSESRLLLFRRVPLRVKRLAPFLLIDGDPYPAVINGRLVWIVDAYTATDRYPYAAYSYLADNLSPRARFNYIRGAVKATVDAYDGTTNLYAVDEEDPLLQSYRRLMPGLIQPASDMPAAVRLHRRFPRDLFRIQQAMLADYHVEDQATFFARSEAWAIPRGATSKTPDEKSPDSVFRQAAPEYHVSRLPNESRSEFTLSSPYLPQTRNGMTALLVARCDGDRYGERVLYQFPAANTLNGPEEVLKQVRANTKVRPYVFNMNQKGSRVLFGVVRTVLVDRMVLNVIPLYVQADDSDGAGAGASALPELRQVIITLGDAVAMAPTVKEALAGLTAEAAGDGGAETGGSPPPRDTAPVGPGWTPLVDRATGEYERSQAALRNGDFSAYGREIKALGDTLRQMKRMKTGGGDSGGNEFPRGNDAGTPTGNPPTDGTSPQ